MAMTEAERTRQPERRIAMLIAGFLLASLGFIGWDLIASRPDHPWGVYTSPAVLGELNGQTVTRELNADGWPMYRAAAIASPQFTTVRCGPPDATQLTSVRDWFVLTENGPVDLDTGATEFVFELDRPDTTSGCIIQPFGSVQVPDEVRELAAGQPIRVRLTLYAEGYLPAVVSTEWFVVAELSEQAASTAQVTLPLPTVSPIN